MSDSREAFEKWAKWRGYNTKWYITQYDDPRVEYAYQAWQAAQAQAGERKCSECGNGEPDLSLYCVRCLNNDHWHLIDPTQAGDGEAVAWMYEHDGMVHDKDHQPIFTTHRWDFVNEPYTETALYTRPQPAQQVNQQLLEALKDARSALRYIRETHGELYGVGFDRVESSSTAAIAAA